MEVRERDFFFMLILHLLKQCVVGIELVDEQIGGKHQYESNHRLIEAGGGGHAQAAGCTIHAPLHEALDQVLAAMKDKLDKTPRPEGRV